MTIASAAYQLVERDFYIFPLQHKSKKPKSGSNGFKDSDSDATPWLDDSQANIGVDLGRSNLCVLDFEKVEDVPEFINNTRTYKVTTSAGVHVYFRGARPTTKLYVNDTLVGDLKSIGGYVLGEGSVHPTGSIYTVIDNSPLADLPDISSLIRINKPPVDVSVDGLPIPYGSHDSELTRIAGVLRNASLSADKIEELLIEVCEKRCEGFKSDYRQMCKKIAQSIGKKPVPPTPGVVTIGGKVVGSDSQAVVKLKYEVDENDLATRPAFPDWIMHGTSLYENLAKPVTQNSSKFPELVWLPAVQLLLNHIHRQVRIEFMNVNTNLFLGIVSPPGKFFKSSSCSTAHEFFKHVGTAEKYNKTLTVAGSKTIVMQAGSSEGFGLCLSNLNANRAILFNDELSKMTAKAGVENSSLPSDLLSWYEHDDFGNVIKSRRESFMFEHGTYCFGWNWCTTTKGFNSQWPKIAGAVSGLEDRMFFLLTPEQPKELVEEPYVPLEDQVATTKELITKAIIQEVYTISDKETARMVCKQFNDPRSLNMVYTFALYFAIDLGHVEITESDVERAVALVKYRNQAKLFLAPIEADNAQGRLQQEIIRELRQNRGKMPKRQLEQELHSSRHGTYVWKMAFNGLTEAEEIFEFQEQGNRGQTMKMVGLRKWEDE